MHCMLQQIVQFLNNNMSSSSVCVLDSVSIFSVCNRQLLSQILIFFINFHHPPLSVPNMSCQEFDIHFDDCGRPKMSSVVCVRQIQQQFPSIVDQYIIPFSYHNLCIMCIMGMFCKIFTL